MDQKDKLKIIVIDDNKEVHRDFQKILSFTESDALSEVEKNLFETDSFSENADLPEFQIDSVLQGKEGVEMIKKAYDADKPYALAFVDIRMPPGWDGIETIKHIWKIDPAIQVVICTAYSDYSWEETIAELGQHENLLILKKPFDSTSVRQLAFALTKKWELLIEKKQYTETLEKEVEERTSSLRELLSISRGTLESAADGILVLNNENNIVNYNKKLLAMFNIPQDLIKQNSGEDIVKYISQQSEDFKKIIENTKQESSIVNISKIYLNDERIYECYTQPYTIDKTMAGRVWSFRDITERIELEKKLEYQATHDVLTGLPNRILFMDQLSSIKQRAMRHNKMFAVIFLDLDRFKLVNDSFGHSAGDKLLKLVAKKLAFILRKTDILARLGGDEFVIAIEDLKKESDVYRVASQILGAFKDEFNIANQGLNITTSIGISIYPKDSKSIEKLLRHADSAMYKAKSLGGNRFQFYTEQIGRALSERLVLENDLHKAIVNEEFILDYQPQYDINTNQIISVEALIRWKHPEKGILLPVKFIPLAEDTGLIIPIGDWVIKTACKQNKQWQDAGYRPTRIAINICSKQILQPDFAQKIKDVLQSTELDPTCLELEITENVIVNSIESFGNTLRTLREIGVYITLDDFGTGNSSINYLRNIPLDRLKIDKSFIENINTSSNDEVIIESIITLARNLNLNVVAEGVETKNQLEFLKKYKCKEIQGYYFTEPVNKHKLEKLLQNPNTKQ